MDGISVQEDVNIIENILFDIIKLDKKFLNTEIEGSVLINKQNTVKNYVSSIMATNVEEYTEWIHFNGTSCVQKIELYHTDTNNIYIILYTFITKRYYVGKCDVDYNNKFIGRFDISDLDPNYKEKYLDGNLDDLARLTSNNFKNLLLYLTFDDMILNVAYSTTKLN